MSDQLHSLFHSSASVLTLARPTHPVLRVPPAPLNRRVLWLRFRLHHSPSLIVAELRHLAAIQLVTSLSPPSNQRRKTGRASLQRLQDTISRQLDLIVQTLSTIGLLLSSNADYLNLNVPRLQYGILLLSVLYHDGSEVCKPLSRPSLKGFRSIWFHEACSCLGLGFPSERTNQRQSPKKRSRYYSFSAC